MGPVNGLTLEKTKNRHARRIWWDDCCIVHERHDRQVGDEKLSSQRGQERAQTQKQVDGIGLKS